MSATTLDLAFTSLLDLPVGEISANTTPGEVAAIRRGQRCISGEVSAIVKRSLRSQRGLHKVFTARIGVGHYKDNSEMALERLLLPLEEVLIIRGCHYCPC